MVLLQEVSVLPLRRIRRNYPISRDRSPGNGLQPHSQRLLSRPVSFLWNGRFLHKSRDEFAFLIKLEEIRRLHRLVLDMYYEIMARSLPPDLGFRRRGTRPHTDPVNTMLSFGHALLFGNCTVAALGARLDPDIGFLHEGKNGLIHDIADPFRPGMVDSVIFAIAEKNLNDDDYELTPGRCILSDTIIQEITRRLHGSIQTEKINCQVFGLADAIQNGSEFTVRY